MHRKRRHRFVHPRAWTPFALLLLFAASACTDDEEPRVPNAEPQQVTDPPAPQQPPVDTGR